MAKRPDEEGPQLHVLAENIILADKASQAVGHGVARVALLELILGDPRWADEFASWACELKMFPAARDLREAQDPASRASAEGGLRDAFDALERTGTLEERVDVFVEKTLRLTYSWLPEALHFWFQEHVLAYAYRRDGQEMVFEVRAPVRAPRVRIPAFRERPGETDDEVRARLRAFRLEVERIELELDAGRNEAPDGDRLPKDGGKHIEQYVSWFYRAATKAMSVCALAKEHHRQRHREIFKRDGECRCRVAPDGRRVAPDDRPAIYAGIRKAKELLAFDVLALEAPDPS